VGTRPNALPGLLPALSKNPAKVGTVVIHDDGVAEQNHYDGNCIMTYPSIRLSLTLSGRRLDTPHVPDQQSQADCQ
jgi:hypothetical protein